MPEDGLAVDQLLHPHADRGEHGQSPVVQLLGHHYLLASVVLHRATKLNRRVQGGWARAKLSQEQQHTEFRKYFEVVNKFNGLLPYPTKTNITETQPTNESPNTGMLFGTVGFASIMLLSMPFFRSHARYF